MKDKKQEPLNRATGKMLNYAEASAATGICVPTLYAMTCKKLIPHYRLSNRIVRFSEQELIDWISKRGVTEQKDGGTVK